MNSGSCSQPKRGRARRRSRPAAPVGWWDGGPGGWRAGRRAAPAAAGGAPVAGLNLAYFVVEVSVALAIGSVSLLADSVDFLEDTAINLLIALALGWPLRRRAVAGHVMALIILVPAVVAAWQAVVKAFDPVAPDVPPVVHRRGRGGGQHRCALLLCGAHLVRVRHHGARSAGPPSCPPATTWSSTSAIMAMALVTAWTGSGWPDIVLGSSSSGQRACRAGRCGGSPVRSGSPPGRWPARTSTTERPGAARVGVRPSWCRAASAPRRP